MCVHRNNNNNNNKNNLFLAVPGTLLPLCFVVALLADILWIPAMAQVGWLIFPSAEEGTAGNLAANAEEAHG